MYAGSVVTVRAFHPISHLYGMCFSAVIASVPHGNWQVTQHMMFTVSTL